MFNSLYILCLDIFVFAHAKDIGGSGHPHHHPHPTAAVLYNTVLCRHVAVGVAISSGFHKESHKVSEFK